MDVSSLSPVLQTAIKNAGTALGGNESGEDFSNVFNQALANVAASDYEDKLTDVGLLTGTVDDLHTATIAAAKADIMLNLTLQVRNKLVEGYQEIMRMQV